jgi:hypothetical protein
MHGARAETPTFSFFINLVAIMLRQSPLSVIINGCISFKANLSRIHQSDALISTTLKTLTSIKIGHLEYPMSRGSESTHVFTTNVGRLVPQTTHRCTKLLIDRSLDLILGQSLGIIPRLYRVPMLINKLHSRMMEGMV